MRGRFGHPGDTFRARPRHRNRYQYAWREFLTWPMITLGAWLALSVTVIFLDRSVESASRALTVVVSPQAASMLLSTVTPGLLTVVSIVFFVLIMAVQHQSTTYSPVVLDQFLRRRSNQLFFGMFVGLTVYCLLVLGLIPSGQAVVAGAVAMLLSAATFVSLLTFVYSAIDQVRPSSTVWMLQVLAARARERQQPLLSRCRDQAALPEAPASAVLSGRTGYIVDIDVDVLARALTRISSEVEVELRVATGEHLVPGGLIAEVRGEDSVERGLLREAVLDALTLGRMRDIGRDAAQAIDNLGSLAWSATARSQDPEGARIATENLHSLLVVIQDQDLRFSADDFGGPLPIVYRDRIVDQILDALTSVIAASGRSGQHQTASSVLTLLCRVLPTLSTTHQRITVDHLQRVLGVTMNHVFTVEIEEAFDTMHQALNEADMHDAARRIGQLKNDLRRYNTLANPTD